MAERSAGIKAATPLLTASLQSTSIMRPLLSTAVHPGPPEFVGFALRLGATAKAISMYPDDPEKAPQGLDPERSTLQSKPARGSRTALNIWFGLCALVGLYIGNVLLPKYNLFNPKPSIHSPSPPPATCLHHPKALRPAPIPSHLLPFQKCSIHNLYQTGNHFLDSAAPLPVAEFISRRNRLAQALHNENYDAFAVEPGYTFSYYGNVTQKDWEVWEPEERPFLMVVRPVKSEGGEIVANTTFLVPAFEAERARLLGMPFQEEIQVVTYEEHWDPYRTLLESGAVGGKQRLMVDDEMRDFISRGLAEGGFQVGGLGGEVEQVRQIKSKREIDILRAVNTGTVEAVRAMRKCMVPGLTEDEVMVVLDNTMRSVGLDPFFDIVLFDEDASNPHGGTDGSKKLDNETMVLIDVGAHLYGYSSDICRSFFPPFTKQPKTHSEFEALGGSMKEKVHVWHVVLQAQSASLEALVEGSTCASVDIAARDIIEGVDDQKFNGTFTHRVGHGIGIKAHESPYLNKGNVNTTLKAGMTFTSEPGMYLVDKFGVRHEDVLHVQKEGLPEILTGRRAMGPWDP